MSIFRYRGKDRRVFKKWKGYIGYVDDHHIIPKHLRNHQVIRDTNLNINSNWNLFIMPNRRAPEVFRLHPRTLIHGPHVPYNKYIKRTLDGINRRATDTEEKEYLLWLFISFLRKNLKKNCDKIPFR